MESTFKSFGRKSCSALCAGALAASMIVMPAAAQQAYAVDAMDGGQYLSCSPTPFAAAWPDYLGFNLTDERWGIDDADDGSSGILYNNISNRSGALKYLLMGTSEYNTNPDAYMYNAIYDTDGQKVVPNAKRSAYSSTNMNRALGFYGEMDTDDAIWNMMPDVVMGVLTNDGSTDYVAEAAAMAEKDPQKFTGYHPIAVDTQNSSSDNITMFYALAHAGNEAIAASNNNKKGRYGDLIDLAKNYEGIEVGAQGYVLSRLEKDKKDKKTIAVVTANDGTNVTLSASFSSVSSAVKNVAVNWATERAGSESSITIPISELESADIDLIILATGDYNRSGFVDTTGLQNLYGKMYWVSDADCGNVGTDNRGPGMIVNYGRILGCLYPEYIDQSDWVAYVYDTVFHIKSDALYDAIDRAMDGVRNWDVTSGSAANDYLVWDKNSCGDYNQQDVKDRIDYGLAYVKAQSIEGLEITEELSDDVAPIADLTDPSEIISVYRLYNPNSGEHFYTVSSVERDSVVAAGWNDENIGWYAPSHDAVPVYRLYNAVGGEHHYTMDLEECKALEAAGWTVEENGWGSDPNEKVKLFREYNPNAFANNHNYTTSQHENDELVKIGWVEEGTAWYAVQGVSWN